MFSVTLANQLLDWFFSGTNFTYSAWYMGLCTGDPGATGANEITGGAYVRQAITFNASTFDNAAQVNFAALNATTATHWGVWSASTSGTFLTGGSLTTPRTISTGDSIQAPANAMVLAIGGTLGSGQAALMLDKAFRNTGSAPYSAWALSQHTGAPGSSGANELSGGPGPYARVNIVAWTTAAAGAVSQTVLKNFPGLPAVTVTNGGVWSATSGGTFIWGWSLITPRTTLAGDGLRYAANGVVLTLA